MARIAIFNQKGGVGKTTTALNLAGAFARSGRSPLLIDLDPQAHLTGICGAGETESNASLYAFYRSAAALGQLAVATTQGWGLVPAHLDLAKVDSQFGKGPTVLAKLGTALAREGLGAERPVLMDACPLLGVLSLSAIFACDRVIVPVSADYLAVRGAQQVDRTLRALEPVLKRCIARRYVLTRFDARRRMSWDILRELQERWGTDLCATRIAETVGLAESPASGRDVFEHAPGSRGAQDYQSLFEELAATGFIEPIAPRTPVPPELPGVSGPPVHRPAGVTYPV